MAGDLARIHLQLRYRLRPGDTLEPFAPELDPPPPLVVVRQPIGARAYFGPSIPRRARERLRRLGAEAAYERPEAAARLLRPRGSQGWTDTTLYRLRRDASCTADADVTRHAGHFVVTDAGRPIAWAWSVRSHALAEEGAVETVPEFRRRGFGARALLAWTAEVQRRGKIAFYPVGAADEASGRLASHLRGEPVASSRAFA